VTTPFIATAFATAFTIIDPVGMIPLTISVTAESSTAERAAIVDRAVVVAGAVIIVMGLVGRLILDSLGISLPAFTIAGGVLLFLISIDMLFARKNGTRQNPEEEQAGAESTNPAVFPLAIPMLAGPGTIATVLVLASFAHGKPADQAILFAAYASAMLVTWICMRASARLLRVIGTTGIHVVTRIFGILLSALAVQFVINGLVESPLLTR
jgi:multiple antibiotic resistance protein